MTRRRVSTFARLAPLLMATASIGACGSSSSSGSSPPATVPGPQPTGRFIAKADALCAAAKPQSTAVQDELRRDLRRPDTAANRQRTVQTLDQVAAMASALMSKLRALAPPTNYSLVDPMFRYLAGLAGQISVTRRLASAIHRDDKSQATTDLRALQEGNPRLSKLARQIGFKVCGT